MSSFLFSSPTQTTDLASLIFIGSNTNFENARLSLASKNSGWALTTLESFLNKSPSGLTALLAKNEKIAMVNESGTLLRLLSFANSVSRHMARIRIDLITNLAKEATSSLKEGNVHVTVLVENKEEAYLAGFLIGYIFIS
jgi:hypothetical protein